MRFKALLGTVGAVTLIFMLAFLPPFFVGIAYGENLMVLYKSFLIPMFITFIVGISLFIFCREEVETVREREAVVAVGMAWLLIAFLGSLPYIFNGILPSMADAFFESMSGFTTTGATVIDAPPGGGDYLSYPNAHSIFLWRSLTQWVGGMGIIVFSVVIISKLLGGTFQLFKAETAGETVTRIRPKIQQTASILLRIYFLFTGVQIMLLWAAGLNLYDAVTHSFTTLSTGGFGTHTSSVMYWDSVVVESIFITFIIIGSSSFVLHYKVLGGNIKALFKDPELRLYLGGLLFFAFFIGLNLWTSEIYELGEAFRHSTFQVATIQSTTGFASADYGSWPQASQLVLLVLMLFGGCVGSTTGAIKVSRILILSKMARREVHKVIHPRAVIPIRVGDSVIPEAICKRIGIFFFAYLVMFFVSSIFMALFIDDITVAASAVAASMGNVGPGLGTGAGTLGPLQTYSFIHPAGKIYLALCMWAGRLEIFSAIILFFPGTYKE